VQLKQSPVHPTQAPGLFFFLRLIAAIAAAAHKTSIKMTI
jgi:hypothetical protein